MTRTLASSNRATYHHCCAIIAPYATLQIFQTEDDLEHYTTPRFLRPPSFKTDIAAVMPASVVVTPASHQRTTHNGCYISRAAKITSALPRLPAQSWRRRMFRTLIDAARRYVIRRSNDSFDPISPHEILNLSTTHRSAAQEDRHCIGRASLPSLTQSLRCTHARARFPAIKLLFCFFPAEPNLTTGPFLSLFRRVLRIYVVRINEESWQTKASNLEKKKNVLSVVASCHARRRSLASRV